MLIQMLYCRQLKQVQSYFISAPIRQPAVYVDHDISVVGQYHRYISQALSATFY